jgi:hypothetical protein
MTGRKVQFFLNNMSFLTRPGGRDILLHIWQNVGMKASSVMLLVPSRLQSILLFATVMASSTGQINWTQARLFSELMGTLSVNGGVGLSARVPRLCEP